MKCGFKISMLTFSLIFQEISDIFLRFTPKVRNFYKNLYFHKELIINILT